ncbi:MAG: hypothetical protein KAT77_03280 [Nanoarchaeota archaeon]|nr:hypothetical protein [Nanoarchaeota archaeon]
MSNHLFKMKRKITQNKHQYKVSLPIELVRKLNWDNSTEIKFHEVETALGKGLLIVKNNEKVLRLK